MQSWGKSDDNVAISTPRRDCEFDAVVSTLSWVSIKTSMINCEANFYPAVRQRCPNVINLTPQYQRCEDCGNLTSGFQRHSNVVNTTSIIYCKLNLLTNVEATMEQRGNFKVVVSTSRQVCVLVAMTLRSVFAWTPVAVSFSCRFVNSP